MAILDVSTSIYKVGGSLYDNHPTYIYRQADREIYQSLKAREYCYVLNARQTGKSSLRVQTKAKLQAEGIACGEVDMTGVVSNQTTPAQLYIGIIQELVNSFSLPVDCLNWWRDRRELAPIQRFNQFIDKVLLEAITDGIVIFIDEIDCFLSLKFPASDFFSSIRFCYNKRSEDPKYQRLTFVLMGVATPSDLIRDKNATPFNIGRAIALTGFQFQEALPLAKGLSLKAENPENVLAEILNWTGGQPFLTQKLCQLVLELDDRISRNRERQVIDRLVRDRIIKHWESADDPQHLRTIRDRLLNSRQPTIQLLKLYRKIQQKGNVAADRSPQQMELQLSGLVARQGDILTVYNRIYTEVFDRNWIKTVSDKLSPETTLDRWRWIALFMLSAIGFRRFFPNLYVTLNDRGVQSYLAGQFRSAFWYYQAALFLNPKYKKVRYNLGALYEKKQQPQKARTEYQIAIQGQVPEAYNNLARLLILEKCYSEAIDLLVEGLHKHKSQTDPILRYTLLKNLGWALLKQGRDREAETYLREAIALMNARAPAYGLLAQVLELRGEKEEARTIWEQFLKYAPGDRSPEVEAWMLVAP